MNEFVLSIRLGLITLPCFLGTEETISEAIRWKDGEQKYYIREGAVQLMQIERKTGEKCIQSLGYYSKIISGDTINKTFHSKV